MYLYLEEILNFWYQPWTTQMPYILLNFVYASGFGGGNANQTYSLLFESCATTSPRLMCPPAAVESYARRRLCPLGVRFAVDK